MIVMKCRFKILSFLLALFIIIMCPLGVSAENTLTESYSYDAAGSAHPAPAGYTEQEVLLPTSVGINTFGSVKDMATDSNGNLYMLCSDENVIRVIDAAHTKVTDISLTLDGELVDFKGATGFYISEYGGEFYFYIADGPHSRVLKADKNGNVVREYGRPETSLIDPKADYMPTKITVNESGFIFVICSGIYSGAVVMDSEGEFISFYGSNQIKITATVLYDYMWKKIFGSSRSGTMSRYVPVEFSNLCINEKGFIYTVTVSDTESAGLRLINFNSNDILTEADYGDLEKMSATGDELSSSFTDIAYLGDDIVSVLDTARNRVFVYNNYGELLTVFGGIGRKEGLFVKPTALECFGDNIYVYDEGCDTVYVYAPTEYGKTLISASRMFMNGNYDESLELWESVLQRNNGFTTAYISIGRSLMSMNDFEGAMKYFKLGGSQSDYSQAFSGQRTILLKKWFLPIFVVMIIGICGVFYLLSDKRRAKKVAREKQNSGFVSVMFHPVNGYRTLLSKRHITLIFPCVLAAWFIINIAVSEYSGFCFHNKVANPLDLRVEFIATVVAGVAFVLSNWLIVTMTEGNGTLRQIATVFGFSMIPYLCGRLIYILLSNFLVIEEAAFANAPVVIGVLWSVALIVVGLMKIHEFTIQKTVGNIILTLLGIAVIAFILLLEISILKQIQLFFTTVMDEIVTLVQ